MTWTAPSNTLVKQYTYIAECDPALDEKHPEFKEKYRHYLEQGTADALPIKDGQEPAVWTLRHLTGRPLTRVTSMLAAGDTLEALYVAAQYALVSVTGIRLQEGGDFELQPMVCRETKAQMITDQCMAVLHGFNPGLIFQIGGRAVRAENPGPLS